MNNDGYKIGDVVRIKTNKELTELDELGRVNAGWAQPMKAWCEKEFVIKNFYETPDGYIGYVFENQPLGMGTWTWTSDMFDLISTSEDRNKVDDEFISMLNF